MKFLDGFPKYKSHYTSSEKVYFSSELNIRKLYSAYSDQMTLKKQERVTERAFRTIFSQYDVGFYVPKADTCATCDAFKASTPLPVANEEKSEAQLEWENHQERANAAREAMEVATARAKEDTSRMVFTFDLEKTQPLPYMQTSVAFYKRQMWIYNLGIHTLHNNKGYMCVWTEVEAKRGANEVASSISTFLDTQNLNGVTTLSTFSDACGGQNRNRIIVATMMHLCKTKNLKTWEHTFMESGHSYLPNDRDFGLIEKAKKRRAGVHSPEEWVSLIEQARPKKPFQVIRMEGKMLDMTVLCRNLTIRHKNTEGEPFSWLKLKWYQVNAKDNTMLYKTSQSVNHAPKTVDFSKKEQVDTDSSVSLQPAYPKGLKLKEVKYRDIISLLPYIGPIYHDYFNNLPHDGEQDDAPEFHPDESE